MPLVKSSLIRRAVLAGLMLAGIPTGAHAFDVVNLTSVPIRVKVYTGIIQYDTRQVNAGARVSFADTSGSLRVNAESLDTSPLNWFATVPVTAGGRVEIVAFARPFNAPPDIVLESYFTLSGGPLNTKSVPDAGQSLPQQRNLRFLATGDPQLDLNQQSSGNIAAAQTGRHVSQMLLDDIRIRGMTVSGDLTNSTEPREMNFYLDDYRRIAVDRTPWLYDGMGNHDYELGSEFADQSFIINNLRNRKRSTILNYLAPLPGAFFSWDWHDVHFVQCGLFPGDTPANGYNPFNSLSHLQADLAMFVGNSGRPVVLVHHYGFDNFSMGTQTCSCNVSCNANAWWLPEHRLAYWEVIKNYNVVLILTGHYHLPAGTTGCREWPFMRPDGASGGPDLFKSFDVAAANWNSIFDINMGPHNEIVLKLLNTEDGDVENTWTFLTGNGVFAAPPDPFHLIGDGSPLYPWRNVSEAVTAIDRISVPPPNRTITLAPGNYPGASVLDKPCRLESPTGAARIGQ